MIQSRYDKRHNVAIIEFSGRVDKAQAEEHYSRIEQIVPQDVRSFKILTDFSGVQTMDLEIQDIIKKVMDYFNERGVTEILRVIPDPAQDIGFNIMSAFHYSKGVKILTLESRQEALARLLKK